ncbi:MAG: hypothetical protein C4562_03850 [Actinobacteria bacterium]|nr:MAG: hypothetical protein C4562_03850 [Actinomycetota bacterium]
MINKRFLIVLVLLTLLLSACSNPVQVTSFKTTNSKNDFTSPDIIITYNNKQVAGQVTSGSWTFNGRKSALGSSAKLPKSINVVPDKKLNLLFYKPRTEQFLDVSLQIKLFNASDWKSATKEEPVAIFSFNKRYNKLIFRPQDIVSTLTVNKKDNYILSTELKAENNKKEFGYLRKMYNLEVY